MNYCGIPGLRAYLSDSTDTILNPNESTESTIVGLEPEDQPEIPKVTTEEVTADVIIDAQETEMISNHYAKLEWMYDHIKHYGVNQEFMAIHNPNGELADMLRLNIPATETIATTGDPHSVLSIACMEGLKDVLKDVWNWIKTVIGKLFKFISRIFEAISVNIHSLDQNIGRLRKAMDKKKRDEKAVEKYEGRWIPVPKLQQYWIKVTKQEQKVIENAKFVNIKETVAQVIVAMTENLAKNKVESTKQDNTNLKKINERLSKLEEFFSKKKNDGLEKLTRPDEEKQKFTGFDPTGLLNQVSDDKRAIDISAAFLRIQQDAAKSILSVTDRMETRGDEGAKQDGTVVRKLVSALNKINALSTKFVNEKLWICNRRVRIVSIYVVNCMKGEEEK